jgi:hypothetical protein
VNLANGGKSEKSTESNGSVMLPIGCGVLGPPKMMATPKIATTKPRQIRRTRFTASNENKMSYGD